MGVDNFGSLASSSEKMPSSEYAGLDEEQSRAARELSELGIEVSPENIEAVIEQRRTPQHPEGFEEILDSLNNPEELRRLMSEKGVKSIVHSEGPTVWDHTKLAISEIESMPILEETKKKLKIVMLYHDLGKTVSGRNEKNIEQTRKKLEKGELHQTMIGHHEERLADIEAGLRANGFNEQEIKIFMIVIKNHMNTSLLEQDPKKVAKLIEGFGENDDERRDVVGLLTLVLEADGNATQHIDLVDGQLKYSKNEKKLSIDFGNVWKRYEEGRKLIQQEEEKRKKQEEEAALETSIFGKKLSDYLVQDRGLKPGPEMGQAIKKIKNYINENKDKSPSEIKEYIDGMEI